MAVAPRVAIRAVLREPGGRPGARGIALEPDRGQPDRQHARSRQLPRSRPAGRPMPRSTAPARCCRRPDDRLQPRAVRRLDRVRAGAARRAVRAVRADDGGGAVAAAVATSTWWRRCRSSPRSCCFNAAISTASFLAAAPGMLYLLARCACIGLGPDGPSRAIDAVAGGTHSGGGPEPPRSMAARVADPAR